MSECQAPGKKSATAASEEILKRGVASSFLNTVTYPAKLTATLS